MDTNCKTSLFPLLFFFNNITCVRSVWQRFPSKTRRLRILLIFFKLYETVCSFRVFFFIALLLHLSLAIKKLVWAVIRDCRKTMLHLCLPLFIAFYRLLRLREFRVIAFVVNSLFSPQRGENVLNKYIIHSLSIKHAHTVAFHYVRS